MHDCPLPHAPLPLGQCRTASLAQPRRQARPSAAVVLPHIPTGGLVLVGGCGSGTLMRGGRRGGSRPQQPCSWCRVPVTGSTSAAWSGGAASCAVGGGGVSCPARASCGVWLWRSGAAVRAVRQPRQASTGGLALSGGRAGHGDATRPALLVPGAVSITLSQVPLGVTLSCGEGGARVGGGGRLPGSTSTRIGPQHPNTALEATGHSVRLVAGGGCLVWPAPQLGR